MEKILIDGYNLLHKDGVLKSQAERSLEAAREQLIAAVGAYRRGDVEIVVVFDGRANEGRTGKGTSPAGVEVRFSRFPQTADQMILDMIVKEKRRSAVTVVTSDRKDIGRIAQAEGVHWISSESFLRRMRRAPGEKPGSGEKPGVSSQEEMDYWMKRFGSDTPPGGGEPLPPSRVARRPRPISAKRRSSR
ncbi:MAG TPA: NYN domain-containing protein [Candidatus Polarisedimenticolia bacterium]|nr:NYN domain-containing protein [Candidatus Polarisedimenticolia bacterium]